MVRDLFGEKMASRRIALRMLAVTLICSLVSCTVRKLSDGPKYKTENGIKRFYFDDLMGIYDTDKCIVACGCGKFKRARVDSEKNICWCGSPPTDEECNDGECSEVYNSDGIESNIQTPPPRDVIVNEVFTVVAQSLENTEKYGCVIDERLAVTEDGIFKLSIAMPGTYAIRTEPGAFHGCQSDIKLVTVKANLSAELQAPEFVMAGENETFCVYAQLRGPDDLENLRISFDNGQDDVNFPTPSGSCFAEYGSNHETNRYQAYSDSYDHNNTPLITVSLNHMIFEKGYIVAFTAHVTHRGQIKFGIGRPFCSSGQRLCYQKRICVADGDPCISDVSKFVPGNPNEVFNVANYQYLDEDLKVIPITHRTEPKINFNITYTFLVNATHIGHNSFPVPKEEQYEAEPGDFLFVTPLYNSDADIAYVDLYPAETKFVSIAYKDEGNFKTGYQFQEDFTANQYEIQMRESMASVVVETPVYFKYCLNATDIDGSIVTSTLYITKNNSQEEEIMSKKTLLVRDIDNYTVIANKDVLDMNEELLLTMVANDGLATSKNEWKFMKIGFENWKTIDSNLTNATFKTSVPGQYVVKASAITKFTAANDTWNVTVAGSAQNLEFVNLVPQSGCESAENAPVLTNNPIVTTNSFNGNGAATVTLNLTRGEGFSLSSKPLNIGDNNLFVVETSELNDVSAALVVFFCVNTDTKENCKNSTVLVQDGVVHDSCNVATLSTNISEIISTHLQRGTNTTHTITFGDDTSTIVTNDTYNKPSVFHKYTEAGNYTLNISSCNMVSADYKVCPVEVQDIISDCQITCKNTTFTTPTIVKYSTQFGTGFEAVFDPGDGTSATSEGDLDIPHYQDGWMGISEYTYMVKNDYNVCLALINDISMKNCCQLCIVEDELKYLNISCVQKYEGTNKTDYIEVNETLTMSFIHYLNAKRVTYFYDFGDGQSKISTSPIVNISYPDWDPSCYTFNVTAINPVSTIIATKEICVQRPLTELKCTFLEHLPTSSKNDMSIKVHITQGNYFDCTFDYNDTSDTSIETISYTIGPDLFVEANHRFDAGYYNVSVFCRNRLYECSLNDTVCSEDVITKPLTTVYSRCRNATGFKDYPGVGDFGNVFDAQCGLFLKFEDQEGTDPIRTILSDSFDTTYTFTNDTFEILKQWDEFDLKIVLQITVKNKVSSESVELMVHLINKVVNMTVKVDTEVKPSLSVPACFDVEFGYMPGDACLSCTMGDGKLREFGGSCEDEGELFENPLRFCHQYTRANTFYVHCTAENALGRQVVSTEITVKTHPCLPPTIKFLTCAPNSTMYLPMARYYRYRSFNMSVWRNATCERPNSEIYTKIAVEKLTTNGWEVFMQEKVLDGLNYPIPKLTYGYGKYRMKVTATMRDIDDKTEVGGTHAENEGYFEIIPSELVVEVEYGDHLTLQRKGRVFVNACKSHDRDNKDTSLRFSWYCQQGDVFEVPNSDLAILPKVSYPDGDTNGYTTGDFMGCIAKRNHKSVQLNEKGQLNCNLELRTDYFKTGCMSLKLKLSVRAKDDQRVAYKDLKLCFVDENPLKIGIKCQLNCDGELNANQKVSYSSHIYNKAECSGDVTYLWKVLKRPRNALTVFVEDTNLKDCVTAGFIGANFGLKKNSLNPAFTYKFEVTASCSPLTVGTGASIRILNQPPDVSKASCFLKQVYGKAMETLFTCICANITDKHTPLRYKFYFQCRNDKKVLQEPTEICPLENEFYLPTGNLTTNECKISLSVIDSMKMESKIIEPANLRAFLTPDGLPRRTDIVNEDNAVKIEPATKRKRRSVTEHKSLCNMINEPSTTSLQSLVTNIIAVVQSDMDLLSSAEASLCNKEIQIALSKMVPNSLEASATILNAIQPGGDSSNGLKAVSGIAESLGSMNADELAATAELLLTTTSEMTDAASDDPSGDNVVATMAIEQMVMGSVAASLLDGEEPIQTKTKAGVLVMQFMSEGAGSVGGFKMPTGLGGGPAVTSVCDNRYGFNKASTDSVFGPVQGMTLFSSNGVPKAVLNLPAPIRMVIQNLLFMPPPKNFTGYCQLLRDIHRVNILVNESVMILNVKPVYDNYTGEIFVFGNKGTAPSLTDHQQNCTLPRPLPDDWVNMTQVQQDRWREQKEWSCYFSESNLERKAIGIWCFGVIFIYNGTNVTDQLLPMNSEPSLDNCTATVPYTFFAYTRACLYWSDLKMGWSGDGCQAVEPETDIDKTTCDCTHLTDFGGGGPFADAEPLDLGSTLSNIDLADNPTVFSVVMTLFAIYVLLLLWARKKDRLDLEKSKVVTMLDNHRDDMYFYEISVQTGFKSGCSTTADIVIVITGNEGESAPRRLYSPTRKCFQRGEIDRFLMAVPKGFGDLEEIDIWHNNAGDSPGWFCLQIQVRDLQTEKKIEFVCNQWLDVAEEDGLIMRKLRPSSEEDLTEFSFLFSVTARRNLYDGHMWLSLFTKPAQSTYTRCQRLATCMALLFSSMICNAMFYRGDTGVPSDSISFGPITFSVDEIKVAFTAALMIVPANLLIIMLFKKAGPKKNKKNEVYEEEEDPNVAIVDPEPDDELSKRKKKHNSRVNFLRSLFFAGAEDDADERLRKKKKPLPHWLIHVAYGVALVITLVSAFFVVMYGFAFGRVKAEQWLVSMLFSFCYSFFLFQPLKVILLSVIFAVLLKSPPSSKGGTKRGFKKEEKLDSEGEEDLMMSVLAQNVNRFKLPDDRRLHESRVARMKEKRIKLIIKEVLVHLSFVLLVIMVAYSTADPSAYQLHESVHKLCAENGVAKGYHDGKAYVKQDNNRDVPEASDVKTRAQWWDWARYGVIDYLFPDGWYDEVKTIYPKGFVADAASSKVLAMARFRQLRVTANSCTKHPVFEHLIVECNAGYSWNSEDDRDFRAGWLPAYNISERWRRRRGKRKAMWKGLEDPWLHQNTTILKNPFPFTGRFATYGGSSYAVSIGPNKGIAKRIIKEMKKSMWVDRYTRALFTEINIYNANTNLMLVVTFLHEILPTGGWNFYTNVQPIRLYRYVGGLGDLIMLFDIVFCCVTIIGIYKAVRSIRRNGAKKYLSNTWNFLHIVVTSCSVSAIAFTLGRMLAVKVAVEQYIDEPELFVSFQYVGALEYLIVGSLGFVLFFTNLEFLRILRFNHLIAMLSKTIAILGTPLASFGMIFMVVFMAYVSFAHCIYVDKLEEFHSVMSSFVSLTKMFLGKFDVHAYFDNAPVFGPLMFASYMLSIQMIMINLFVGLICDAFAEVGESDGVDEEPSVLGFMADRFKGISGAAPSGPEPIYSDWKDDWDQMMEDFNDRCDNCIYLMRNFEGEEFRQNKFFDPETADNKKKDVLVAVLGLDFFCSEVEFCDGLITMEKRLSKMSPEDAKTVLRYAADKRRNMRFNDEM